MKAVFDKATTIHIGEDAYICLGIPHKTAMKFVGEMKQGTKYEVEIKQYRKGRSLDANAYFHLLCGKIAEKQNLGLDEVKVSLVCEYGTVARDDDGEMVGFKLPSSVNVHTIYKYVKCFDTRIENGKEFNCYIVFKRTRDLNTKEMSRLIEGAVYEAKELGIETLTPEELARMSIKWGKANNGGKQ